VNNHQGSSDRHISMLQQAERIGTIVGAGLLLALVGACASYLS
jgi:hypothetical protein